MSSSFPGTGSLPEPDLTDLAVVTGPRHPPISAFPTGITRVYHDAEIFLLRFIYFMHASVLPVGVYVRCMCVWCLWGSEEDAESPGTGVTGRCELLCGCCGLSPGPLPKAVRALKC